MRIFTYIVLLLVILLGITFAALNAEQVQIHYYIGTSKIPLSLLLVIVFICGGLLAMLASLIMVIRLKSANRNIRQRLKVLEAEVSNLRALPLKDAH